MTGALISEFYFGCSRQLGGSGDGSELRESAYGRDSFNYIHVLELIASPVGLNRAGPAFVGLVFNYTVEFSGLR
jgi:hypothetical protein